MSWVSIQCLCLLDPWVSWCVKWNICFCDASWRFVVLWLVESEPKPASSPPPRTPLFPCPLCKLLVNEWAGHLTPWGSTSGSSDHQLLCLALSHAPVNMMKSASRLEPHCTSLPPFLLKQVNGNEVEHDFFLNSFYRTFMISYCQHLNLLGTCAHTQKWSIPRFPPWGVISCWTFAQISCSWGTNSHESEWLSGFYDFPQVPLGTGL